MKNNRKFQILIGLLTAVLFGGSSYFIAMAQPDAQPVAQGDDCYRCHPALYASWHASPHGQASNDPIFQEKLHEQSDPEECLICHTTGYDPETGTWESDGISCSYCHGPVPEDHPDNPASINRSSALCETCHAEAVYEWKTSEHRGSGLDCVDCHSQHTATLKAADAGLLCVSCHHDIPETYSHIIHNDQNLSCPDCHMEALPGAAVEERGYAATDHNFDPKINTCDNCHEYRLNNYESNEPGNTNLGIDYHDLITDMQTQGISLEPDPVNPVSFAIVSAIIGMVAGLVLAPWIQARYRRSDLMIETSSEQEVED